MYNKADLLAALGDPARLETAYRANPGAFMAALRAAHLEYPDDLVLRVWMERLFFEEPEAAVANDWPQLPLVIGICLAVSLLVKLPGLTPIDGDWWYPRFTGPLICLGLMAYYFCKGSLSGRRAGWIFGLSAATLIYAALLPSYRGRDPDSVIMALIHLTVGFVGLVGLSFLGSRWRSAELRLRFVRYLGELSVITAMILLGGIVLSLLTFALFSMISIDMNEFYVSWIVVAGCCSAPIVGTYLYDTVFRGRVAMARVLARVFAPLFLLTVVVYLLSMLTSGTNPMQDREALITFNGLLLIVLAITVFSLAENAPTVAASSARSTAPLGRTAPISLVDWIHSLLILVTLLINLLALSAIVFRLGAFGFTVNRVVVLGTNLLVFGHLLVLGARYRDVLRGGQEKSRLTPAIAGYLPLYSIWTSIVVFIIPVLFR